jgi:hypothetical protein
MSSHCKAIVTLVFGPLILIGLGFLVWTFPILLKWGFWFVVGVIVLVMVIGMIMQAYEDLVKYFDRK